MPPRRGPLYKEVAAGWSRAIATKPFSPGGLASAGCGGKRHHPSQLAAIKRVQLVLRYGWLGEVSEADGSVAAEGTTTVDDTTGASDALR
jgi:hypothetical protein